MILKVLIIVKKNVVKMTLYVEVNVLKNPKFHVKVYAEDQKTNIMKTHILKKLMILLTIYKEIVKRAIKYVKMK